MIIQDYKKFTLSIQNHEAPLIAIDHGKKSLAIAISDPQCRIATPLIAFESKIQNVVNIIMQNKPKGVIVGMPINTQGKYSRRTQAVVDWSKALEAKIQIPILLFDERFSSKAIDRIINYKKNKVDYKQKHDMMAATYILQNVIDIMQKNISENNSENYPECQNIDNNIC